ncbi:MAG TPA: DnaJ domain-containing protein [Ilumatobacteraceae bacterium]|nr:DnaJ domain-containing protein [Ilumatobacteraceae bacterium]
MTHYEVLGVGRGASTAQVRAAFRRRVREHHPDTSESGSAEELAAIKEAWRVLGDPHLRRDYDRALSSVPTQTGRPERLDTVPVAVPPSNFPWRFLIVMAVAGIAIVLLGVLTAKDPKPRPPDNVLEAGSCVVIEDNGDAAEVDCADDHMGVVVNRLADGELCPTDAEPHRDQQGLGTVCVRFDF